MTAELPRALSPRQHGNNNNKNNSNINALPHPRHLAKSLRSTISSIPPSFLHCSYSILQDEKQSYMERTAVCPKSHCWTGSMVGWLLSQPRVCCAEHLVRAVNRCRSQPHPGDEPQLEAGAWAPDPSLPRTHELGLVARRMVRFEA